jgi:hypothetical protein
MTWVLFFGGGSLRRSSSEADASALQTYRAVFIVSHSP